MESTKKLLNIAISISIVLLSLSALVYSAKDSKAKAAPAPQADKDGYFAVGVAMSHVGDIEVPLVVLYNPETKVGKYFQVFPGK